MTTRDVGIALHEELDRREKLIATLEEECGAIRTTLAIVERGGVTPEARNRVTRVVGRRGKKKNTESEKKGGGGIGAAVAVSSSAARDSRATSEPATASPAKRRTIDGEGVFRCETCGAEDFTSKRGVGIHRKSCDGIRRTEAERKKAAMDRWLAKRGKAQKPQQAILAAAERHHQREERMPLPMRKPADVGLEDDADDDDDFPEPAAAPVVTRASLPGVRCLDCDEKFPDAKALGIHRTRVHFGADGFTRKASA